MVGVDPSLAHTDTYNCGSAIAKYRLCVPSTSIIINHCIAENFGGIDFCQCCKGHHILINKGQKKVRLSVIKCCQ